MTTGHGQPKLRRTLGPIALMLYGLGNILGAGIYVLVGEVAGIAGYLAPVAFIVAALVAGLAAFSYGELAARHPVSAGEAAYVESAFGSPRAALWIGLAVALSGLISAATLSRGVVGYLQVFIAIPDWIVIATLVTALGAIALWGIKESVRLAAALTLVEAGGLLIIIWVAFTSDSTGELPALPALAPDSAAAIKAIGLGAFLAFFAFIGFEDMVNVAEEVERPERNLPLAIIGALIVATVLYMLVLVGALLVVSPDELAGSKAPLALVYEKATGEQPHVLAAIGTIAAVNGVLVQLIMAARIFYGLASRGLLPVGLGHVSTRTRTPTRATVLAIAMVLVLALAIPLGTLARATSFIVLAVFAVLSAALLVIKRTQPLPDKVKPVPTWIPALGLLCALALLAAQSFEMMR